MKTPFARVAEHDQMFSIASTTDFAKVPRPRPLSRAPGARPKAARTVRSARPLFGRETKPVIGEITVVTGLEQVLLFMASTYTTRWIDGSKNGAFA